MDQVWDPRGEAGTALARVVEGFGQQVLGRADMLEGLLQDDIPQLPRETALLTAAARAGVADLLAERVRQGISPQAAISMAATEMTARTAVDASGAPWAAGVFAQVLGYQLPGTPLIQPPPAQAAPAQAAPAQVPPIRVPPAQVPPAARPAAAPVPPAARVPAAAPPTAPVAADGRDAWGRPVPDARGTGPMVARSPGDQMPTVLPADSGRGLAIAAAVCVAAAAPMGLLWGLDEGAHGGFFWLSAALLMAGLGGAAIWAVRGWRGGAGFAVVIGVAVPAASWGIYAAAAAASFTSLSTGKRDLLELISAVWVIGALTAGAIALAGVVRWRQPGRRMPGFLLVVLTVAGIGFAFGNILAQDKFQGESFDNVLGHGVRGWYIVWGIAFLLLVSVPPLLAAFMRLGPRTLLAFWLGWLIFALAWQVSSTPTNGLTAAAGLYVTWTMWAVALAGTVIMAGLGSAGTRRGPA